MSSIRVEIVIILSLILLVYSIYDQYMPKNIQFISYILQPFYMENVKILICGKEKKEGGCKYLKP